jgi:2-aminoethylphosphonate-pyruvate transaminase
LHAVILAAGAGERLKPTTNTIPKGLIEIGEKSLLEYSLDALNQNGIKKVAIVIGYLGKAIMQKFGKEYKRIKINYIWNKEYRNTGSMFSLSKAKGDIDGDIILLESDLLYDPAAIEILLDSDFKDCMLVTELSGSGDEVYICVDDNQRIVELGKNMVCEKKETAIGELSGISKFSKTFLDNLFRKAEEDYNNGQLNHHYEECAFAVSKSGAPLYAVPAKDLAWTEIDNKDDLKRAREEIYPQIKKKLVYEQRF